MGRSRPHLILVEIGHTCQERSFFISERLSRERGTEGRGAGGSPREAAKHRVGPRLWTSGC